MDSFIPKEAAVIVPVFRQDDEKTGIVLIHRSEKGVHAGQLAFPGGRCEEYDDSTLDTALRETEEEIGIDPSSVNILESLSVVETYTTGFRIHPFLAKINLPEKWDIQQEEVRDVLLVSAEDIARPENHGSEMVTFSTWSKPGEVPYIRIGDHKLWGVSYRILKPLIPRLLDWEWKI